MRKQIGNIALQSVANFGKNIEIEAFNPSVVKMFDRFVPDADHGSRFVSRNAARFQTVVTTP
jgi:hypothetical protein